MKIKPIDKSQHYLLHTGTWVIFYCPVTKRDLLGLIISSDIKEQHRPSEPKQDISNITKVSCLVIHDRKQNIQDVNLDQIKQFQSYLKPPLWKLNPWEIGPFN